MEGGKGLSADDCEEVKIWWQIVSCQGLLFDLFVLLYTASFGMQRISRGDLEKVTKVKLLDRGALPSLRPRRSQKRVLSMLKFHKAKFSGNEVTTAAFNPPAVQTSGCFSFNQVDKGSDVFSKMMTKQESAGKMKYACQNAIL